MNLPKSNPNICHAAAMSFCFLLSPNCGTAPQLTTTPPRLLQTTDGTAGHRSIWLCLRATVHNALRPHLCPCAWFLGCVRFTGVPARNTGMSPLWYLPDFLRVLGELKCDLGERSASWSSEINTAELWEKNRCLVWWLWWRTAKPWKACAQP